MAQYYQEPTPVQYSAAGIKRHHYVRNKNGVRLHWHDRMELIRLHRGTITVGYGDYTATLEPGQLYIVPPRTPHAVALAAPEIVYDVLMFDVRRFYNETDICQKQLKSIFDGSVRFSLTTGEEAVVEAFDRLYAICEEESLEAVAQVYRLLQLLLDRCVTSHSLTPRGDATIGRVIAYMEENFSQELTTEQLAERFGYSTAHFCRKFREATWLSPMNYLRIYRLEEAARRLHSGLGNVSDVALYCGFPDPNYFTRCFKKHFGVPPTRYEK